MTQSADEKRGYSKGYAAGKRAEERSWSRQVADRRREEFRQAVFLAILPELVRAPWRTGSKTWTTTEEFVDGAWKFATAAARGTAFSGDVDAPMIVMREPASDAT